MTGEWEAKYVYGNVEMMVSQLRTLSTDELFRARINNYTTPHHSVGCNYSSMLQIPADGAKVLKYAQDESISVLPGKYIVLLVLLKWFSHSHPGPNRQHHYTFYSFNYFQKYLRTTRLFSLLIYMFWYVIIDNARVHVQKHHPRSMCAKLFSNKSSEFWLWQNNTVIV